MRSPFFRYGTLILASVTFTAVLFPGFYRGLFSTGSFMPHATCYLRDPKIIWLHVTSDSLIGISYVSISLTLGYLVYKASKDLPFHWVLLAFGLFIVSCGFTHLMEVWTVWKPVYWFSGYVKAVTAVASAVTAIALFPLVPRVFRAIDAVKVAESRRQEIVRANQDLATRKTELERANRDLEMFTYSVAHDLKTPARAIGTLCALLAEEHGNDMSAEGQQQLRRLTRSADKMQVLLSDLLQFARISRDEVQVTEVRLQDEVAAACETLEQDRAEAGGRIQIHLGDERVQASRTLLREVVTNLVGNSLKYVARGVAPEIRITKERRGEMIRVWVEDNGIGIDPSQHQKVFGLFVRLHSSEEYEGTGLGLAIVERAIDRMKGRVGVESAPGQGSRFWFELRAAP